MAGEEVRANSPPKAGRNFLNAALVSWEMEKEGVSD